MVEGNGVTWSRGMACTVMRIGADKSAVGAINRPLQLVHIPFQTLLQFLVGCNRKDACD
jgi:C4-dicarboxylate transporter